MIRKTLLFLLPALFLYLLFFLSTPSQQSGIVLASFSFFCLSLAIAHFGSKGGLALERLGVFPKKGQSLLRLVALGVIFALLSALLAEALSLALFTLGLLDSQLVMERMATFSLPILIFASTLAPLSEEMLFRGAIFGGLQRFSMRSASKQAKEAHLPFIAAAALSSLLFAFMHLSYGSLAEIAVAFAIGFALCLSVRLSDSLIPAIVAHACFNIASIIFTVVLG